MAVDEQGNEIIQTPPDNKGNPEIEGRIKALSSKVEEASKERDAERARAEKESAEKADLTKERDFYQQFSDVVTQNPAAKDHRDEILAKVKAGYTTQDATYAVLGAQGKLGTPQVQRAPITGGSASTTITPQPSKEVSGMSREDMRNALMEAQRKGDFYMS